MNVATINDTIPPTENAKADAITACNGFANVSLYYLHLLGSCQFPFVSSAELSLCRAVYAWRQTLYGHATGPQQPTLQTQEATSL